MSNNNGAMQTPIELKFHDEFYNKIFCGDKTQTTRLKLKEGIHLGKLFAAAFPNPENENLPLIPTKVTIKQFTDLDEDDAKREGYLSEVNLKMDLLDIYPNLKNDFVVYCIEFYLEESLFNISENKFYDF